MAVVVGPQDDVPLVGRQRELEILRAAVTGAADGTPGAVLVAGEAGVREDPAGAGAARRTAAAGSLVVRAQCVDLGEPGLPYLAMVDLVRALQAASRRPSRTSQRRSTRSRSSARSPTRRSPATAPSTRRTGSSCSTRWQPCSPRSGGSVVRSWWRSRTCSGSTPRRPTSSGSCSAGCTPSDWCWSRRSGRTAWRPGPGSGRLLSELGRLPRVRRLDLEPFDATEVAESSRRSGRATPTRTSRPRCSGVPAGIPTTCRSWRPGCWSPAAWTRRCPRALGDLLVGRLDGLPDDARTVVQCAAVVARRRARPAAAPGRRA